LAAQPIFGSSISFNYRYVLGVKVRGNAAGVSVELVGDFGHMTYTNKDNEKYEFYVTKVTFNTPAEHIIDNS